MKCMSEGRSLYRIYDKDSSKGCHEVKDFNEADHWSEKQWGIFWTVNRFEGPRRKENCREILAWAVDLDSGTKEEQLATIRANLIEPSVVYETARGHHVYFDAIDGDPESYRDVAERLVDAYRGDKNAKDVCRILRVPGYMHWKGEKPFAVNCVYESTKAYTETEMRKAFPVEDSREDAFEQKASLRKDLRVAGSDNLWERVWSLDCKAALERVSGSSAVGGEMYSFKKTQNGWNILVDGKGTSCWIDAQGRIGSADKGGPSIFQWINWFHRNPKRSVEYMRQLFPEVFK